MNPSSDKPLDGLRVFIVEDEFLLAILLQEDLQELGCTIVGPFSSLARAIEASRQEAFDVAILDINVNGQPIYPLADELLARGRPTILLTGYGAMDLPERLRAMARVTKPYDIAILTAELARAVAKKT